MADGQYDLAVIGRRSTLALVLCRPWTLYRALSAVATPTCSKVVFFYKMKRNINIYKNFHDMAAKYLYSDRLIEESMSS